VTKFDYIVLALLAISALVGFARGAVRELAAMLAVLAGALAALFGLPYVLPLAARMIRPDWLAAVAVIGLLFGAAYIAVRLVGAHLVRRVRNANVLGALDRTIGLLIGVARGVIVLGALYLMFIAATPEDLRPAWIVKARSWPLARDTGRALAGLAPHGLDVADRVGPAFARIVREPSGDRSATGEYDPRERGEADDPVEKSR